MTDWSDIFLILGLPLGGNPDSWVILGVPNGEKDQKAIDAALKKRRKELMDDQFGLDPVTVHKFESEILMPAYHEVCEVAQEDEDTIKLKDNSDSYGFLDDDADQNDSSGENTYGLVGEDADSDSIGLVDESYSYKDYDNVPDNSNSVTEVEKFDGLLPEDHGHVEDQKIAAEDFLSLPDDFDVSKDTSNDDSDIPVLEAVEDDDDDNVEMAGKNYRDEDVPVIEALVDDLPDDFLEKMTKEDVVYAADDVDIEEDEPELEEVQRFSSEKLLIYALAAVPVIVLVIFAMFLFKSDPKDNADDTGGSGTTEIVESAPAAETTAKAKPDKAIKEKFDFGFVAQDIPEKYLIMIEELAASYTYQDNQIELLEDIVVTLQAWQIIAGNVSDFESFVSMLRSDLYRGNGAVTFGINEYALSDFYKLLDMSADDIKLPVSAFNSAFGDTDSPYRSRIIELASVSGGSDLRDTMFSRLTEKESYDTTSRIIRGVCTWLDQTDQLQMLDCIIPSRRDLANRVFNNLNARYSDPSYGIDAVESAMPFRYNRADIEKTLKWWQTNILTIKSNARVNNTAAKDSLTAVSPGYKAVLLSAVWKNAYMLNSIIRDSVFLPPVSPDLEIGSEKELPVDQLLADSMDQIVNGILAVIYDLFSKDDVKILNDIDIIRYSSREYDFVDRGLRAQSKAKEILIYCKLMKGEKYDSTKMMRIEKNKSTYLVVRDTLFESLKRYAAGNLCNYAHDPTLYEELGLDLALDYGLIDHYNSEATSENDYNRAIAELRQNPFSKELYQAAMQQSLSRDEVFNEGLVYLQLGIKALKNKKFGSGTAIAIDCFSKAVKWPVSKQVLQDHLPALVDILLEDPDYLCPHCGNTGFVVCDKCEGNLFVRCDNCGGDGSVIVKGEGRQYCPDCGGYGKVACFTCDGRGVLSCIDCYDHITDVDLFLPNEEQLKTLQQAVNLAALNVSIKVKQKQNN